MKYVKTEHVSSWYSSAGQALWDQLSFIKTVFMQDVDFTSTFVIGIPGGQFSKAQNRWMLPVQSQGLHYPPRLLATFLLIAHHRFLARNERLRPTTDDHLSEFSFTPSKIVSAGEPGQQRCIGGSKFGPPSGRHSPQKGSTGTKKERMLRPADGCQRCRSIERHLSTDCGPVPVTVDSPSMQLPETANAMKFTIHRASVSAKRSNPSQAVGEGLERIWWNPNPGHGEGTAPNMETQIGDLEELETLESAVHDEAALTDSHDHSELCSWQQPMQSTDLFSSARTTTPVLEAFLNARDRVIEEMQSLHGIRQTTVPEPEDFLAGFLQAFSADILASKHIRSTARTLLPTPDTQLQVTDANHGVSDIDVVNQPMKRLVAWGIRHALDDLHLVLSSVGSMQQHAEELDSVIDSEISHLKRESCTSSGLDSESGGNIPRRAPKHRSTTAILPHIVAWHLVRLMQTSVSFPVQRSTTAEFLFQCREARLKNAC